MRHGIASWLCAFALLVAGVARAAEPPQPLTVFAAASLKESMDEAALAYQRSSGQAVRVSFAASSALARQIEQGAPADVYLSADIEWMDNLQARGKIDAASRRNLLGNTLVLVVPTSSAIRAVQLRTGVDLLPFLGERGRIAMALTASVPAGKYAKAGLMSLGVWSSLQPHLAEAENVRAALLLVSRGEAPLGVVYGSDALADPKVRTIATFPTGSHPPIVYPVARVSASRNPQAAAFVRWLQGTSARAIFQRHGFAVL